MLLHTNLAFVGKQSSVQCFKTDPNVSIKVIHVFLHSVLLRVAVKRSGKGSQEAQGSLSH